MQFIDLQAQQAHLRDAIDAAIARVLDHGKYVMGPEVASLESALGEFCGAPEVVSCASGTDALVLALLALGVGPGDAVFVPSFTYAATAEAVALLGATPVFVDSEPDTFNLDPDRLADAVAGLDPSLRGVGVIPVDLFGLPADYARLGEVASSAGLWTIADAAQSFGGAVHGVDVGRLAEISTTSFFPAKPLGCYGDGGAVFCTDPDVAAVLRSLRVHGSGEHKYDNARIGINGRLDTIQAAILLEKLAVFRCELDARDRVAEAYGSALGDVVAVPVVPDGSRSTWAQYTLRVDGGRRDRLAARLADDGIPYAVYYPLPLHQQTAYRGYPVGAGGLAVSERLAQEVISLPMHPYLSADDQDRVVGAVRAALTA
jgi:dTDP-4-amino-4,6-dideoxygalactose transaminase